MIEENDSQKINQYKERIEFDKKALNKLNKLRMLAHKSYDLCVLQA